MCAHTGSHRHSPPLGAALGLTKEGRRQVCWAPPLPPLTSLSPGTLDQLLASLHISCPTYMHAHRCPPAHLPLPIPV